MSTMSTARKSRSGQGVGTSQIVPACTRCAGLLLREGLLDLFDDTGHIRRWAWRCVQCGDIVDSLILRHRTCADLSTLDVMRRRHWMGVNTLMMLVKKPANW